MLDLLRRMVHQAEALSNSSDTENLAKSCTEIDGKSSCGVPRVNSFDAVLDDVAEWDIDAWSLDHSALDREEPQP